MTEQTLKPDSAENSIRDLIERFQRGSAEAGQRLWELYGILVRRAVRRRLPPDLRPVFDSEDFTQQVFASFFDGIGRIPGMDRPAQLIAYLQTMAHNKVVEEYKRRKTGITRNDRAIRSLEESIFGRHPLVDKENASPSEVAMSKDQLEKCLSELPAEHRRLVELRANGLAYKEIADTLGMHENSVRRVMANLFQRMTEE